MGPLIRGLTALFRRQFIRDPPVVLGSPVVRRKRRFVNYVTTVTSSLFNIYFRCLHGSDVWPKFCLFKSVYDLFQVIVLSTITNFLSRLIAMLVFCLAHETLIFQSILFFTNVTNKRTGKYRIRLEVPVFFPLDCYFCLSLQHSRVQYINTTNP